MNIKYSKIILYNFYVYSFFHNIPPKKSAKTDLNHQSPIMSGMFYQLNYWHFGVMGFEPMHTGPKVHRLTWLGYTPYGVNRNWTDIFDLQNQYSNLLNYNPILLCIGLEPITFWLGIKCSTYWANKAKRLIMPNIGLEPIPLFRIRF